MFSGEGAARLANSFTLSQQIGYRFIRRERAAERRVASGFSARHRNRGGDALRLFRCLEAFDDQPDAQRKLEERNRNGGQPC